MHTERAWPFPDGASFTMIRPLPVTILDRRGLQQRPCECYGLSKREFDRLLGDPPRREARPRKRRPGA